MREHISFRALPVALLIAALYLLLRPYAGLIHDSRLYLLQALNHLHPDLYGADVFLKYGSQDKYTLFTPVFAVAISLFGAEGAAIIATFVSITALLFAAWSLARTLMPERFAWLALGLLVIVPGFYGQGVTFAVLEEFMTPRLCAEALVLFALSAWLRELRVRAAVLLLAGFLLHPIMTFPALILIVTMACVLPRWRVVWPIALVPLAIAAVALTGVVPLDRFQFDPEWWPMADRVPHLVLGQWTIHDWARVVTVLSTLLTGALCLEPAARRLSIAMLVTCLATLLLAWVGGDLLKVVVIVQGQAWRSLWLAAAIATLLLPWIVVSFWQGGGIRRSSALLLITAWVVGPMSLALLFSIPAAVTALWATARGSERSMRLATVGAGIVLAVTVISMVALTWSELGNSVSNIYGTGWTASLRKICMDGIIPAAALLLMWHLAARFASQKAVAILSCIATLPLLIIGTASANAWPSRLYSAEAYKAFAAWRALIPPGQDVLWSTKFAPGGGDPSAVWLLLERPSYYSSVQTNSGLFSRPAAMELFRRSKAIPLSLPTEMPIAIAFKSKEDDALSCNDLPVRYIVTNVNIRDAQVVPAPTELGAPYDALQLRICPER